MNSVIYLKRQPFLMKSFEEKLLIKSLGRPTPQLNMEQGCKPRRYKYMFRSSLYEEYPWMCGCEVQNALYCFPCLLFEGKDIWSGIGIITLSHISTIANKHMESEKHINSVLELSVLGRSVVGLQATSSLSQDVQIHNKQVDKNRNIASRMIDLLKTSRNLDLDEGKSLNLEQILKNLDTSLENCIQESKLFQEFCRPVQEDLLQCIFDVCRDQIVEELNETKYVTVILDDTTAVSSSLYLLVIFRYELDGDLHERFWDLVNIEAKSHADILQCILKELKDIYDSYPNKIIAVSFEGPSMMPQADTLESKIREHFPRVNYVRSYDHHLNTIVQNAALSNCSARKFLSCLPAFPEFLINAQRFHLLEAMAIKRGIYPPPDAWDFKFQTAVAVCQVQEDILECCLELENSLCTSTVQKARILRHFLQDEEFLFWLNFFFKLMPQVQNLDDELKAGQVDTWKAVGDFTSMLYEIKNEISESCKALFQGRNLPKLEALMKDCHEVCEVIVAAVRYCLKSSDHLEACKLLDPTCFTHYSKDFPQKLFNSINEFYPDINKFALRCELGVIYQRMDFREMEGALMLLQFLYHCGLEESFFQTMNLLRIIITLPVITSECDRCPGLVKRIKTFMKNSSNKEHSASLMMISLEKKMVLSIKDFNNRVLGKLANRKAWMLEFNYKK